ncbi:hypothetical protein PC121_g21619 [Phytophthora cactorum]|nr:hypothetical protein PC120_g23162 [Phytophthora cactorum]KAG3044897.1 hypothetical protein PC121_g21619 [Phytophthora cactorum]
MAVQTPVLVVQALVMEVQTAVQALVAVQALAAVQALVAVQALMLVGQAVVLVV